MRQSPCSHGTLPNIAIPDETRKACFIRFPNIRYSITNNEKIEKSMSEFFSKNVIINKSDTILMQGNGIFLLGSLDMACETHRSTNIFEDCESAKHVAIWYQRGQNILKKAWQKDYSSCRAFYTRSNFHECFIFSF